MTTAWITTASTHVEAIVNPLTAACHQDYVPDRLYIIENPGVTEQVDRALDIAETVITEYGGDEPAIELTTLDADTEFERIHHHIQSAIDRQTALTAEAVTELAFEVGDDGWLPRRLATPGEMS